MTIYNARWIFNDLMSNLPLGDGFFVDITSVELGEVFTDGVSVCCFFEVDVSLEPADSLKSDPSLRSSDDVLGRLAFRLPPSVVVVGSASFATTSTAFVSLFSSEDDK